MVFTFLNDCYVNIFDFPSWPTKPKIVPLWPFTEKRLLTPNLKEYDKYY